MITRVEIENFQSHHHTVVDLVNGVNVIIGPSDAGKSAVFRAINWVVSNRPLGEAYRSEWGGDTKVTLTTDRGDCVVRLRTDKLNAYEINGTLLKAFGSEPPEEVFQALEIDPYNVQSQMDPPFLLAASPGEVAQTLNRAASIDDIDHTIGGLKRNAARIGRDINYNNEQLIKYELQAAEYAYLEDLSDIVEAAEKAIAERQRILGDRDNLTNIVNRIHSLRGKLVASGHVVGAEAIINSAVELGTEYGTLYGQYDALGDIVGELKSILSGLEDTEGVEAAEPVLQKALASQGSLQSTASQIRKLSGLVDQLGDLTNEVVVLDEGLADLEQEYESIVPDTCPLCGNTMKEDHQ